MFTSLRRVERVECEARSFYALVVAADAVLVEHGARRRRQCGRLLNATGSGQSDPHHRADESAHAAPPKIHRSSFSGIAAAHGGGHFISLAPSFRSSIAVCG